MDRSQLRHSAGKPEASGNQVSSGKRPNLEFYRKQAKQLLRRQRRADPEALRLFKYNHGRYTNLPPVEIAHRRCSLRDAQTVVARVHGFTGWTHLRQHVETLHRGDGGLVWAFEQAADAVVDGDLDRLVSWLDRYPKLVGARSSRAHRSTLLHYLAANGIEHDRQRSPGNAVAVARCLLERGAEPDALAQTYGGGASQTTLMLLVSSAWPAQAGVQEALVECLCRSGANPEGVQGDGLPLITALVFFYPAAAVALRRAGASVEQLIAAAAVGTVNDVDRCFNARGSLRPGQRQYRQMKWEQTGDRAGILSQALTYAALCGNLPTTQRLVNHWRASVNDPADRGLRPLHLAAWEGHVDVVRWLIESGADPHLRDDTWESLPAGWAAHRGHRKLQRWLVESMSLTLHEAVELAELERVRKCLAAEPGVTRQVDARGNHPLHLLGGESATASEILNRLVDAGAKVNGRDAGGRTPLDRMLAKGRHDLAERLRHLGGVASENS